MPNNMTVPEWTSINDSAQAKLETIKALITPLNAYAINSILNIAIQLSDKPEILQIISRFGSKLHEATRRTPQTEISEIIDNAAAATKETLVFMDGIRQLQKK